MLDPTRIPDEFDDLSFDVLLPGASLQGQARTNVVNKLRQAYPNFTESNRVRSVRPRSAPGFSPAEEFVQNIAANPTAPLEDLLPQGYRPFRFNEGVVTATGRDIDAGDLILVPEQFATTTGRSGQPLATEFFQPQTDRMLPSVEIEGTQVKTVEGPTTPVVVPFTGQERRLLEDLRDISPETNRVFDEAANSSILRADPDQDPFIQDFYQGQREADETFQQLEDDRLIVGGETPSATETREILDAVNGNMTQFQPVTGGFREMTDLIMEVVPRRLAQLMEAAVAQT